MAFCIPIPSHSHPVNSHIQSIPIYFHFYFQIYNHFSFPWDLYWAFPIPSHSHSRTIVQLLRHKQFWFIEDADCALLVVLKLITTTRITFCCIAFQRYWTSQIKENMFSGTLLWPTVVFYAEQNRHQNRSPMKIYSNGNKGHSHSHARWEYVRCQMASKYVERFQQGTRMWQTYDRQTTMRKNVSE